MNVKATITKLDVTSKKSSIGIEFEEEFTEKELYQIVQAVKTQSIQDITIQES